MLGRAACPPIKLVKVAPTGTDQPSELTSPFEPDLRQRVAIGSTWDQLEYDIRRETKRQHEQEVPGTTLKQLIAGDKG